MRTAGRTMLILGFAITIAALFFFIFGNIEFPRGNTVGDWQYHNNNVHVYVPILGCLIVSAVVSFALWLAKRR